MNWEDEGIVLGVKTHGETAVIVDLLTRAHGRHLGLVHGGRSRRLRPVLQVGNHVQATWRARLAEHLGHLGVELIRGYAAEAMASPTSLVALSSMTTMARLLPERDPHPNLFEITLFVLGFLDDPTVWPALMVRWEMALLEEMGMGLDLSVCAATGSTQELIYVSPRSGRAVSARAGEPYKDRLLALPAFLSPGRVTGRVTADDVRNGFALTGFFLQRRVLAEGAAGLPEVRARMLAQVEQQLAHHSP